MTALAALVLFVLAWIAADVVWHLVRGFVRAVRNHQPAEAPTPPPELIWHHGTARPTVFSSTGIVLSAGERQPVRFATRLKTTGPDTLEVDWLIDRALSWPFATGARHVTFADADGVDLLHIDVNPAQPIVIVPGGQPIIAGEQP